jgi:hypothetical protein
MAPESLIVDARVQLIGRREVLGFRIGRILDGRDPCTNLRYFNAVLLVF